MDTSFADANAAMEAVQWEQRFEFATEGLRFFDLRRWDNLLPAGSFFLRPFCEGNRKMAKEFVRK